MESTGAVHGGSISYCSERKGVALIVLLIKRSRNGGFIPKTKNAKEKDNIFYSPTGEELLALTHLSNMSTILCMIKNIIFNEKIPHENREIFYNF